MIGYSDKDPWSLLCNVWTSAGRSTSKIARSHGQEDMLASQFSPWGCLSVFMTWQVASPRARAKSPKRKQQRPPWPRSKNHSHSSVLPTFPGAGGRPRRQGSLRTILGTVTSELYWYFLTDLRNFSCCDSSLRVILSLSTESFVSLIPFPFLTFSDFLFFFF